MHTSDNPEIPNAIHAEITILGGMFLDETAIEDAIGRLEADDFLLDSHRRIFRAILALREDGMAVDYTTVSEQLKRRKEYDTVGGIPYLMRLTEGVPRKLSIESYVRIVKDKAQMRQLLALAELAQTEALDRSETARVVIQRHAERLQGLLDSDSGSSMERMGDYLSQHYAEPDAVFAVSKKSSGVPSGFTQYDELTNGFHRDELTVVAARPAMGKTAWVGSLLDHVARAQQRRSAVFILEQAKKSLMTRMLCGRAVASLQRFNKGESTAIERQYIREAMDEFRRAPLYWDDQSQMTTATIRAKARRLLRDDSRLDLLIVDQLSHIGDDDIPRTNGMKEDAVIGRKCLNLKKMAKELHIPVVLMCQINRASIKNKDSRPTLADLADSGRIEQHADNIVFLHRPEYYDRDDESLRGQGEMIIAKQRDGPIGTCQVQYIADCCRWKDSGGREASEERIPW